MLTVKKKLHQKLAKHPSRKVPRIPKHYFSRPHIPPQIQQNGRLENEQHYRYKIFLGETLRDNLPYLTINYEYKGLPPFWHERYSRHLRYTPDIYVEYHDDELKRSYYSDIEINGGIHYKNKDQILKTRERLDHIYPYLQGHKTPNREDYKIVASYIIIDVDDFEYFTINDLYLCTKSEILLGGLAPKNIRETLTGYLKVAV